MSRSNLRGGAAGRTRRSAACLATLALLAVPAWAARTRTLSTDSYEAFRKGELEGVAVSDDGRVLLGPEAKLAADPGTRTVWALVPDGHGGVVLATGNAGLVARRGAGSEGDAESLATLFDAEVFALCGDGRGAFYAAGAPVGTITRLRPGAEPRTLFDAPEGVVFALLAAADGSVYAGTGDRGRLYRISPDGEGKVIYEAPDFSVRTLAWGTNGRIWAGTDPRGLLLEIDPGGGSPRVWYDAAEDEIVALLPQEDGGLVFAVNPGASGSEEAGSAGRPGEAGREGRPAGGGAPSRPGLYRLNGDGSVRRIWSCPETLIHAVERGAGGETWVATSEAAALYRVSPAGREELVWRPKESQVLSLCRQEEILWVGTGGPGRLYRLSQARAAEGTFTGVPLDAGDQARWGVLRWIAAGRGEGLSLMTRSGYTENPDETWTEWAAPRAAGPDWFVTSPPGRFLQWRARFSGAGAGEIALERVDVAAASANGPPRIASIRLSPDEPGFTSPEQGRGFSQTLPNGVQIDYSLPGGGGVTITADEVPQWVRRLRSVVWDAQDPDGDDLEFKLELRPLGAKSWRTLAEDLRDRAWTLDQGLLPDGHYELRLTASDAPGNAEGATMEDLRVTPPFRIDTVPPVLAGVEVRRTDGGVEVTGTATDEASPIRRVEVSLDGKEYRWLTPEDGLLDGLAERFTGRASLSEGKSGEWIVVRAQDAAGNRGLHRAWLEPVAPRR